MTQNKLSLKDRSGLRQKNQIMSNSLTEHGLGFSHLHSSRQPSSHSRNLTKTYKGLGQVNQGGVMKKSTVVILMTSAILLSGHALAMDGVDSDGPLVQAPQVMRNVTKLTHSQSSDSRNVVRPIQEKSVKRIIRIITEPLPENKRATRAKGQGRFVIGTDNSRDNITVYKSVKHSKVMPNLFNN